MNVLYIDFGGVVSDTYMYQYYGDLYRELRKLAKVYFYQGELSDMDKLLNSAPDKFNCIIFGLGYFAQNNAFAYKKINGLSELNIPVACMIHKPQTMLAEKLEFCKTNNVDLIIDSQSTYKDFEKTTGIKSIRSPFTATPKYFYPREVEKEYDIGFCGALHGIESNGKQKIFGPTANLRNRVYDKLIEGGYNIYWNSSNTLDYRIHSTEEYATQINKCKVWLGTTGPVLDVSPRYFEVMLSKTLLMCNKMPEQYEDYFIDGVNCVMFDNDLSNFNDKLTYYLENDEERNAIIETAYETAINNYTWKHMALNLIGHIKEIKNAKD